MNNAGSGQISRIELEDGVVRVDGKGTLGEEKRWFLRFRQPYAEGKPMHLHVVYELQEKEPGQEALWAEGEVLGDHFRIVPSKPGSVAVFFPADKETSNLRFHLHAPFIPELSRASIKEHPENVALLERLAALAARSLPTLRDLGLLDREFLGVLPNSQDPLSRVYRHFGEAVVRAMRHEPLVPMHGGGHQPANRLLQGRAEFKDFLGVDDIRFLMSGWDSVRKPHSWSPSRREFRRGDESPPDYCGWAVSATQRNTLVDRLLTDLRMDGFEVQYLAPPQSETESVIEGWIKTRDADWHRAYYASVANHWDWGCPAFADGLVVGVDGV